MARMKGLTSLVEALTIASIVKTNHWGNPYCISGRIVGEEPHRDAVVAPLMNHHKTVLTEESKVAGAKCQESQNNVGLERRRMLEDQHRDTAKVHGSPQTTASELNGAGA